MHFTIEIFSQMLMRIFVVVVVVVVVVFVAMVVVSKQLFKICE